MFEILFIVAILGFYQAHASQLFVRQENLLKSIDWDASLTPFPQARRENISFQYDSAANGTVSVPDYYNWFEEVDKSKDEIEKFKDDQLALTKSYLSKLQSELDFFQSSIKESRDYTYITLPLSFGSLNNLTYIYRVTQQGDTNHDLYYYTNQEDLQKAIEQNFTFYPGTPFLDTGLVGVNRTAFFVQLSPDGTKILYKVGDKKTFENQTTYVRDFSSFLLATTTTKSIEGGEGHYPKDVLLDSSYLSAFWSPDGKGIFYGHVPRDKNASITVRYHVLGSEVKEDIDITPPLKDPFTDFEFTLSDDLHYIFVNFYFNNTQKSNVYAASIDQPITNSSSLKWISVVTDHSAQYYYATNIESDFFFYSEKDASNGKIIMTKLDFTKAQTIKNSFDELPSAELKALYTSVNERSESLEHWGTFDTDKIILVYNVNDLPELYIYDLTTGNELQKFVPEIPFATVDLQMNPVGQDIFLHGTLLNSPMLLYHFKFDQNANTPYNLYFRTKSDYIDPDQYIVEQKWTPSKDGTQIPFFLFYSKSIQLDGTNPTVLQVQGAYGESVRPWFFPHYFSFVHDYQGIIVLAGVRGGNDVNGSAWRDAAKGENKHRTFEDLIAVADYLVDNKYTGKGKLILYGEQLGGGMTSMAVINQVRQGLFVGSILIRGIYDMLRFDHSTQGEKRIEEFGNPHDPKAFDWLFAYSPLHHVDQSKEYPLIVFVRPDIGTAEVWPAYKMLAELQYTFPKSLNPFFLLEPDNNTDYWQLVGTPLVLIAHAFGFKRFD